MGVTSVAIVVGAIYSSIPEDPEAIYQLALRQLESFDSLNNEELPPTLDKLKTYPEYADQTAYVEGRMAAAQQRHILALQIFEKAMDNEQLRPQLKVAMGDSLGRIGRYEEAIKAYEEAIRLQPENSNGARLKLARLYFQVGANGLSEKTLLEVCKTDEGNREARTILARICDDADRFEESLGHMKVLLANEGDFSAASPELLRSYTRACLKVGDQEALQELSDKHTAVLKNDEIKAAMKIAVGETEELKTAYGGAVSEGLADLETELGYVDVLLATDDTAAAGPIVEKLVRRMPRNLFAWELAVRYYGDVENAERLAVAEENVKQLKALKDDLIAAQAAIANEYENVEGRVRVFKALIKLQEFDVARGWFGLIKQMDPDYVLEDPQTLEAAVGPLVPFESTEEPTEEEPAKEPAQEEPAEERAKEDDKN